MCASPLDELLARKRLTRAKLAPRMRVSRQYVNRLARQVAKGKTPLSTEDAERLATALGLDTGSLGEYLPVTRPAQRRMALDPMRGVEVAYLKAAMDALAEARRLLLAKTPSEAIRPAKGKSDTKFADLACEYAIERRLRGFDKECAVFTEEGTVPEWRDYADRLCYFVDPLDGTNQLADFLRRSRHGSVGEALAGPKSPLKGLRAPYGAIACLRHSQILFSAMMDYASGELFVACAGMRKHGNIALCRTPESLAACGEDIRFGPRYGLDFVTFVGQEGPKREQYEKHLKDLKFLSGRMPPENLQVPVGPARILYLSDDKHLVPEPRPAFIMSNGEKICEWLGWLAYAVHSRELCVYEVYAETFSTRDRILLAPPPDYSLFSVTDKGCEVKLDRIKALQRPVLYRSALVMAHVESADVAMEMMAIKEGCRELPFQQRNRPDAEQS